MEFTIGNHNYRTVKLDVFQSFHVGRKISPCIFAMGAGTLQAIKNGMMDDAVVMGSIGPLVAVISSMSDADSQFVLDTCLNVCSRQEPGGWAKIFVPGGGLIFQDIEMPTMLKIVAKVIQENLGNFLDALPTPEPETAKPPQA